MEQCVTNQDFAKAAELKQQITELEEQKEILASEENSFSQTVREEKVISRKYSVGLIKIDECGRGGCNAGETRHYKLSVRITMATL